MNLLDDRLYTVHLCAIDLAPGDVITRRLRWRVLAAPAWRGDGYFNVRLQPVDSDGANRTVLYAPGDRVPTQRRMVSP